jgi:hypothetical protein
MSPADKPRTMIISNRNAGFFSNFNCVLNNLHHRLGRHGIEAARVEWHANPEHDEFVYGRPTDGNLWLRFFEPLPFHYFPTETLEVRTYVDFSMTGNHAYEMYKLDRGWRDIYHALFNRYIRVKQPILDRVETIYGAEMAGRYCIGVHYRSPTHAVECPDPIDLPEAFAARVRRLVPAHQPCAVMLATDVEPAVDAFRKVFGGALIVQPGVVRASTLRVGPVPSGGDVPRIALGEQVLIDCLLLGRCETLVHITSNLATAVGYINPKLKMVYCETPTRAAKNHFSLLYRRLPIIPRLAARLGRLRVWL